MDKFLDSMARFFEVVPFFAVAGVLAFLLGAVGGFSFGDYSVPAIGAPYRIALMLAGVLLVAIEIIRRKAKAALPNPKKVGITIDHPGSGDVLTRTAVRGKYKEIPEGYKLRLIRGWESGAFLPAWDPVVVDKKAKTWLVTDTDIGGSPGQKRFLKICLVGPDSDEFFDYWLSAHFVFKGVRETAEKTTANLPWLPQFKRFPSDVIVCDEVMVVRRQ